MRVFVLIFEYLLLFYANLQSASTMFEKKRKVKHTTNTRRDTSVDTQWGLCSLPTPYVMLRYKMDCQVNDQLLRTLEIII